MVDRLRRLVGRSGVATTRVLKRWGSRILALLTLVYAAIGVAQVVPFPNSQFWTDHQRETGLFLFLLGAVVLMAYPQWRAWRLGRELDHANHALREAREVVARMSAMTERAKNLTDLCAMFRETVAGSARVKLDALGCSLWAVPRDPRDALIQVIQLSGKPHLESGVQWTRGKGVVGRAWLKDDDVMVDFTEFRGVDEKGFEALDEDTRVGLTWAEYRKVLRYSVVWASPLRQNGNLVGLICVDCDEDGHKDRLERVLKQGRRARGLIVLVAHVF